MSAKTVALAIRTPEGLAYEGAVRSIRAEDVDGWFGVLPGRRDVVAVLPPGLVLFEDDDGEGFVAISGGLLDHRNDRCRVMAREARLSRAPMDAAAALDALLGDRRARSVRRREVADDLEREALRRMARALRETDR